MKKQKLYGVVLIGLLIAIGIMIGLIVYQFTNGDDGKVIVDENQQQLYKLPNNATEYQTLLFDELSLALETSETTKPELAGLIVKNFVADFYTWTNKKGTYDVGGLQYVYSPEILNIHSSAKNLFYVDLSYLMKQYDPSVLLEVDSISIKYVDPEANFIYGNTEYESYYVGAEWTYVFKDGFNEETYQTKGYFSVLVRDNKLEIYRYFEE